MKTTVDSILSTKYYDGCPNATVELLRKFQIDTSKREAECANQSCYMLFYTVASWLSSTEWICPVKDIATNSIVAPKNINCTNVFPAYTVTPGPTKQHSTNQTTNGGTNFHVLGETTKQTTSVLTSRDDALEMLALWNIPPSEIVLEERLAEGAFGEVWRATYRGENVAVKTLLKHKSSRSDLEIFIEEIKLMAKYKSFVVRFLMSFSLGWNVLRLFNLLE
ncbi:unnamed protein product [Aphanomyces euteiches]